MKTRMIDPQLVAGFLALALLTISPGADMALVAKVAVARGHRAAVWTSLGICAGLPLHAAASALGLAAVLAASATAFTVVKLMGAGYLIWLGICAIREAGGNKAQSTSPDKEVPAAGHDMHAPIA